MQPERTQVLCVKLGRYWFSPRVRRLRALQFGPPAPPQPGGVPSRGLDAAASKAPVPSSHKASSQLPKLPP